MMAATFLFALMSVFVKLLHTVALYEVVFCRAVVSAVFGYALIRKKKLSIWGNNKPLLIFRGLAGTAGLILFFYTVQEMPLATAVTLSYLAPLFTILMAGLISKDRTSFTQWAFFILAFVGVALMKGFDARISFLDLSIGVIGALCSASAYNFVRRLGKSDHPFVITFYFPIVALLIVTPYTIIHWVTPKGLEWIYLIGVGLTAHIAQICMTKAYQLEPPARVSQLTYLGSIYAIFFGVFLFQEHIPLVTFLGLALVVFSVLMATKYPSKA